MNGLKTAAVFAAFWIASMSSASANVPMDPQRPFTATTCEEALERVTEAARGSPLISAEENQAVLMKAIDEAKRLCLPGKGRKE